MGMGVGKALGALRAALSAPVRPWALPSALAAPEED